MSLEYLDKHAQSLGPEELERAAGQMIVAGFDGADGTPPTPIGDWLSEGLVAGVILFSRNIESGEQVTELNREIHSAGGGDPPPLVSVDQEGGRVARLDEGFDVVPPMWQVWHEAGRQGVADVSHRIANQLAELGFNLNYAPVLDVRTNPDNEVIGDRAFSDDPDEVARAAVAFIEAHREVGVMTCGKHFPGHGDTLLDSHEDLPVVDHDLDRLCEVEFPPFVKAIRAGVPSLMTAHVLARQLDAEHPATLSRGILNLLRDELGFDGVIVSDDIEMAALADRYDPGEIAERGLHAGIDLFLVCHRPQKAQAVRDRLVSCALRDPGARKKLQQSAKRVRRLRTSLNGGNELLGAL